MRRTLDGKRVAITGASSGIGRELAVLLASAGARLLLTSDEREPLTAVAETLTRAGADVCHLPGDIASPEVRSAILAAARDRFGGLDIWINNAGVGRYGSFLDEEPSVLRRIMEVNFFAVAECCRAAAPMLAAGTHPLIVNVSSMFGRRGVPGWSSYCASKFALSGFSEALRSELAATSVDLLLVLPGVTRTGFGDRLVGGHALDLSAGADPRTVARQILRGIRKNRTEVAIGRDSKWLVLLNRLFPGRVFPTTLERRLIGFARPWAGGPQTFDRRSMRVRQVEVLRALERVLPRPALHALLLPLLWYRGSTSARAEYRTLLARHREPRALYHAVTRRTMFLHRYRSAHTDLIYHWPDRLREGRWQRRCRWSGEAHLQAALASGRPLVLATVHYGALHSLFYWLRSRGIPVATMALTPQRDAVRAHYDSLADAANGLSGVPSLFGTGMDDLYKVRDFLTKPGNALLVAIDGPAGGQPTVVDLGGMAMRVRLGAFAFASMSQAVVLPCLHRIVGGGGAEIHFGSPVPDQSLSARRSYPAAAKHVLDALMPLVRELPEQGLAVGLGAASSGQGD